MCTNLNVVFLNTFFKGKSFFFFLQISKNIAFQHAGHNTSLSKVVIFNELFILLLKEN